MFCEKYTYKLEYSNCPTFGNTKRKRNIFMSDPYHFVGLLDGCMLFFCLPALIFTNNTNRNLFDLLLIFINAIYVVLSFMYLLLFLFLFICLNIYLLYIYIFIHSFIFSRYFNALRNV